MGSTPRKKSPAEPGAVVKAFWNTYPTAVRRAVCVAVIWADCFAGVKGVRDSDGVGCLIRFNEVCDSGVDDHGEAQCEADVR